MKVIPTIEDGTIDMVLTSPPYKIGKEYDETIDYEKFLNLLFPKIKEDGVFCWQVGNIVNKGTITPIDILTNQFFLDNGYKMLNRVIWHFGHGYHCKNRFSHRYETVCVYVKTMKHTFNLDDVRIPSKYPNKKHYKGPKKGQLSGNPLGKNPEDVWTISNVKHNHPEKTDHPCQFPEALCERLIKAFSNKGDIVMDPFMGSGTTGIVASGLDRDFLGIEMESSYFDIAQKRINV